MARAAGRRAPLVIVEGDDTAMTQVRDALEADGWQLVEGWRRRHPAAHVVVAGIVRDERDAADALMAALAGHGVAVHAVGDRTLVARLYDDLRRIGPVEHRGGQTSAGPELTDEQRQLVDLLANGCRLGEAAAKLNVSRRTADRRLAAARAAYGVDSTTALLAAHARRRA